MIFYLTPTADLCLSGMVAVMNTEYLMIRACHFNS